MYIVSGTVKLESIWIDSRIEKAKTSRVHRKIPRNMESKMASALYKRSDSVRAMLQKEGDLTLEVKDVLTRFIGPTYYPKGIHIRNIPDLGFASNYLMTFPYLLRLAF